ncbi:52 kDa repressor of the inhibitor of the protein kinase-like [Metopolophium dirhodum]|uniref:52 kDa repressor of the inhibitor of the protein kinase-like n=1 Tax=Metopolophium dirhodum TaxID=44670 RepID=UPI002990704B|nr:52 kDa repressor of the inhibitor of the protein kinase-like [Metopolophium dirhodum]XP_060856013.1 52 kDa repressor of the inhibitor of the protein kinase-like [Metopolophium dirhodum]XP_060866698.1 52 kDa repressor of the inhibitor of the protein kinase-like [Metopolophium dirhodum]
MDSYITELEQRFVNHKIKLNNFQSLFDTEENEDKFIQLADDYKDDLEFTNHSLLSTEYKLWQRRLKNMGKKPENALQAMTFCNKEMYPSVFKLLQILATIPVSTASNERSFSNLKRIKTYLRNSMNEARLNGLAMMSIHRDEQCLTVDAVLAELGKTKRRLDFIL